MSSNDIRAIFWDFGGVIADSPFANLATLERERGLPEDFLRMTNARNPDTNAWAQFERGDIDLDTFDSLFREETAARGHPVNGRELLPLLEVPVRPRMVTLLQHLAPHYRLACLTNNLPIGDGAAMSQHADHRAAAEDALSLFELVLESSRCGSRKPETRFYEKALAEMGLTGDAVVFLDDLGINLKPARQLGMTTLKVTSEAQAIAALSEVLGEDLAAAIGD